MENVTLNLVIKYNVSKELIYISQSRFSQITTLTTLTYMSTLCFGLGKIISCTQDTSIFTARKRSLGQGNIFAPVCHSVYGGGSTWVGTPQAGIPPWAGTPPRQVHLPWPGTPPWSGTPPATHAGIRSTSGRYTSYWNAFLSKM